MPQSKILILTQLIFSKRQNPDTPRPKILLHLKDMYSPNNVGALLAMQPLTATSCYLIGSSHQDL